jgi:hypothetical protein
MKKSSAPPAPELPGVEAKLLRLRPVHVALSLATLHLLLIAAVFNPTIFTGGDNGVYVALSRSLVELHAYLSIHNPVPMPHTHYPPGYPAILALAALIGINPWLPIKLVTVPFSAVGVVVGYLWLRRRCTPGVALFAAFVTAISPGLLALSYTELSDVPFWALLMLALWSLEGAPREARGRILLAGMATAAAYLTRTAALPIVVAAIGWLALEKRWRQLAIFAAIALPAMAWWYWWTHAHAAGTVYGDQFWYLNVYQPELGRASPVDLLKRIPDNVQAYGGTMLPLLFRGQAGPLAFGLVALALAIAGWSLRLRRIGLSEWIFPLYGGMLLVCPVPWAGERYMLPILPLALAYAAEATLWGVRRWSTWPVLPIGAAATAGFVLLASPALVHRSADARACRSVYRKDTPYACLAPAWEDYLTLADWSRRGLPGDAVVISRKPGLFFALSDRRGIDIPKTERPAEFFRLADEAKARYLVLDRTDNLTGYYAVPVVVRYINSFCLVHVGRTPGTAVLGIRLEAARVPVANDQAPSLEPCPASYVAESHAR